MGPLLQSDPPLVGPFRLEARLGSGGMGDVYLASSPGGKKIAVKVIRAEHAGDPQFRRRFAREIEAARRVGGFHTAQIVAADPEAPLPWLASAYIPGPSLRELVADGGPLAPESVRALGAALAEGLAAIHACGLVHRDLKPGNVIMAPDGPRIIDFGIAQPTDASGLTSHGAVVGTFAFMSPEQLNGGPIDAASDLFSLAAVLCFASDGRGPFDAGSIGTIVHRILTAQPDLSNLPREVLEPVSRCLAKNPSDRPTAVELLSRFAGPVPAAAPWPAAPFLAQAPVPPVPSAAPVPLVPPVPLAPQSFEGGTYAAPTNFAPVPVTAFGTRPSPPRRAAAYDHRRADAHDDGRLRQRRDLYGIQPRRLRAPRRLCHFGGR